MNCRSFPKILAREGKAITTLESFVLLKMMHIKTENYTFLFCSDILHAPIYQVHQSALDWNEVERE